MLDYEGKYTNPEADWSDMIPDKTPAVEKLPAPPVVQNGAELCTYPPPRLSDRQLFAVEMIVRGHTIANISRHLRVHRNTIRRWLNHDTDFKIRLRQRREEIWAATNDRLRTTLARAAIVLDNQVASDNPNTAFRAAYAMLQLRSRFDPDAQYP